MRVLLPLLSLSLLLSLPACARQEKDFFSPFKDSFEAELSGTLHGMEFAALLSLEAQGVGDAARKGTITFYAPSTLSGTVLTRAADGTLSLSAGDLSLTASIAGLSSLFDLFPTDAPLSDVRTQNGFTVITGEDFTLSLAEDGTPLAITTPTVTVNIVRFEKP